MLEPFKSFITEHYVNLIGDHPDKEKHAEHVHSMLQRSYAAIGGIKGNGFQSPQHMVKHIHHWKLVRKGGKIVSGVFYKNKGGRKIVATAHDGSDEGRDSLKHTLHHEFKTHRSYVEASGPLFGALHKMIGKDDIHKHVVPRKDVNKHIDDQISKPPEHDEMVAKYPHLKDHFYQRDIGGHKHTKIILGHPGNDYKDKK